MRAPQPSTKSRLALLALLAGAALSQGCLFPPRWDPPPAVTPEAPDADTSDVTPPVDGAGADVAAPDASMPDTASSNPPDVQPPRDSAADTADATTNPPDSAVSRDSAVARDVVVPPDVPSSVDDASALSDGAESDV